LKVAGVNLLRLEGVGLSWKIVLSF